MKTTFNNIEKKKNLDSIQAIRGIAALLVMLFHFRVYFNFSFFPVGDFLFSHGEIGVTIFFIISGFIMEYSHSESGVKPALRFAIKRLTRVYPLYFIATMIWVFIIYYFDLNPSILNIENIIKSLSFQPLIGEAPYFGYSSLYVGWTLNYEMMFYFSFFISMLSYKFRTIFFYLFWMLSLTLIPFICNNEISINPYHEYNFNVNYLNILTSPIIWNFIAGVTIAKILLNGGMRLRKSKSIVLVSIATIAYFWIYVSGFNAGLGIMQWGIFSAVIIFLLVNHELHFSFKIPKPIVYLGKISFSLYLIHSIAQLLIESILIKIGLIHYAIGLKMGIMCIIASILLSHFSQKTIEQKISNRINSILLKFVN